MENNKKEPFESPKSDMITVIEKKDSTKVQKKQKTTKRIFNCCNCKRKLPSNSLKALNEFCRYCTDCNKTYKEINITVNFLKIFNKGLKFWKNKVFFKPQMFKKSGFFQKKLFFKLNDYKQCINKCHFSRIKKII